MSHSDNVQATGFVEHLKLPHWRGLPVRTAAAQTAQEFYDAADAPQPMQEAAE
jgi:alpha-D-ribose 1-methylphosphonate 5-triphosphate synthase subunit PhnI